jgi:alkylation response protein AidB-like acyl-CoA dehydrogenase
MDQSTLDMLRDSVHAWCARNQKRLEALEHGRFDAMLFGELDEMGVLHMLHDASMRDALPMAAETVHAFAAHSASLALLVAQQNMAGYLMGSVGARVPLGWASLPLYDAPGEWAHQIGVAAKGDARVLDGTWTSLPALPMAELTLLPVGDGDAFALVELDLRKPPPGLFRSEPAVTLGLRACPVGDLTFATVALPRAAVIAEGAAAREQFERLWSQAGIYMQAIRAALLAKSYATALEYAKVRVQGGKVILEHTHVRRMLANLALASARFGTAWRDACAAFQTEKALTAGHAAAFIACTQELPRLASDGIQLLGGNGYMEDYGQERLFRDAKQLELVLGRPVSLMLAAWETGPA